MFLEAPAVSPFAQPTDEAPAGDKMEPTVSLPQALQEHIHQGKTWCILAFSIESAQDMERLQKLLDKSRQQFQVRCLMTQCDMSSPFDRQRIQAILAQHPDISFYANGMLQQLTVLPVGGENKPEVQALAQSMEKQAQ